MTDIKHLLTEFKRFAHGQSLHTAFTELLDWTLLPFKKHDDADAQRKALETYQSHPKVDQLVKLVTLIGESSENFCDPLGELYQQAISNGHNGQYWSPEPICDMMAAITFGTALLNGQSVADPACGSGRMLLAAAKFNRHASFYGSDLDITCCKITVVNMLLNSLEGEVAHMNTLSNDFYRGFKVDTVVVGSHHIPFYTEFTDAMQSYIWLKPLKGNDAKTKFDRSFKPLRVSQPINGVQGSLF